MNEKIIYNDNDDWMTLPLHVSVVVKVLRWEVKVSSLSPKSTSQEWTKKVAKFCHQTGWIII